MRYIPSLIVAASLCVAVGCEDKKPTPAATSATAEPIAKLPTKKPPRKFLPRDTAAMYGRRRGNEPGGALLGAALKAPELTDEQRTKLEALTPKRPEGRRTPKAGGPDRDAYRKTMVEAVKAGKFDAKSFDEHIAAMSKAREEKTVERAKLLNSIHAILTPAQRKAVAESVRGRFAEAVDAKKGKGGEEKGEEAEGDRKGPPEPGRMGPGRKGPGRFAGGPAKGKGLRLIDGRRGPAGRRMGHNDFGLKRMATGLDLTEEQTKKLDELMKKVDKDQPGEEDRAAKREEARKSMLALLDAFEKDTFDATKLDLAKKDDKASEWMKKQMTHFSAFLAILTEEQRTKLAKRFEERMPLPEAPSSTDLDKMVDGLDPGTAAPAPSEKPDEKPKAAPEPENAPEKAPAK